VATTLAQALDLGLTQLDEALAAAEQDLEELGKAEAYRRAAVSGQASARGQSTNLSDSEAVFMYLLPVLVTGAATRKRIAEGHEAPSAFLTHSDLADEAYELHAAAVPRTGVPGQTRRFPWLTVGAGSRLRSRWDFGELWTEQIWGDPVDAAGLIYATSSWFGVAAELNESMDPYDLVFRLADAEASLRGIVDVAKLWRFDEARQQLENLQRFDFLATRPATWDDARLAAHLVVAEGAVGKASVALELLDLAGWSEEINSLATTNSWGPREIEVQQALRNEAVQAIEAEVRVLQGDWDRALELTARHLPDWWMDSPREASALALGFVLGRGSVQEAASQRIAEQLSELRQDVGKIGTLTRVQVRQGFEVGRRLESLDSRMSGFENLFLDAVNVVRDRGAYLDNVAATEIVEKLVAGWRSSAPRREAQAREAEARALVGETAWGNLNAGSQQRLIAYVIVRDGGDASSELIRLAGVALMLSFETELKAALVRGGTAPRDLPETLDRLVSTAYARPDSDQLHGIAEAAKKRRIDGHNGHRNRATHGDEFTAGDLQAVVKLLLQDGLYDKGLIGLLAQYGRGA